ncbi:MAG TPA: Xaa-Pro peptidase family protein [Gemmatimonadaceae bacterium]|nr:Xaa-Pro peptidase family protein [Gemmatimonadaceae bacterium]
MKNPTFSRRSFLGTSTLAVAATACGVTGGQSEQAATADGDLPKPIAALTSMADQATPISTDERRARLDRARELMQRNKIDAVVLPGGTSLRYFTGLQWGISERLLALVLPAKGKPFMVTPHFEEARAMEQLKSGPIGTGADILTWQEHESPYALVAKGLKDRGISSGTLGAEETLRFMFADGIAHAAPALKVVSATPVTAGCRMVKDHHEIALMRLASAATLRAYRAVYESLDEGMTQATVRDLISTAHSRLGFNGGASVQVGEYSALPHGSRTPQTIREGTIIMVDGGCEADGYRSDITRTFVLGKPADKMKQVFDIVHRAQSAALAAAKPGAECQSVDAAGRKVIVDAGYGPDYTYFSHRLGHGIGMDGHEWPYLVRGNTLAMERGMTFSDEPGIYIPGEFGVRLEDDMHITPSGAELLTPQSPSLEEPFGGMST